MIRVITIEDISNMRSKGAKIPEQWESLEDADISELTNTFAYNMYQDPVQYMANGGEVGDPEQVIMQMRWHILEEFLIMRILDNQVNQVNIGRLKRSKIYLEVQIKLYRIIDTYEILPKRKAL